jgi:hypothetical protein
MACFAAHMASYFRQWYGLSGLNCWPKWFSIHAHEKHTQIADHYRPKYIPMWVDDLMIKFDGVKL